MDARALLLGATLGLLSTRAHAGAEIGLGLDLAKDLPDAGFSEARAGFGFGPSVRVPLRVGLVDGLDLRVTPRFLRASGWDTVTWTEGEGALTYASTTHTARLSALELTAGPELFLGAGRGAALQPFLGAEAGFARVAVRHLFSGAAAESLTEGRADRELTSAWLAPAAGVHAGLRWSASASFALEVEAGYNVSFLNEVALEGAGVADATVAALGLNGVRMGAGATFSFGDRTPR